MLKIEHGDLFTNSDIVNDNRCVIAHGCNAQRVMGSGFALEIKTRYPEAYNKYMKSRMVMGSVIFAPIPFTKIIVANCITQEFYGRNKNIVYVDYDSVKKSLTEIAKLCNMPVPSIPIHLPFIGGGLANGDRDDLLKIFNDVFIDSNATLWIN